LAFGFFDGIHIGHRTVIKSAVDFAHKNNTKSAVITFQDHPFCFFYNLQPQYIMRKSDKIKFLEELGVDYLYFIKFDEHLASMSAEDYLKDIMKNFEPTAISTGFNHHFGAKKSGDDRFLAKMQDVYHYQYFDILPVLYDEEVISSTAIRGYLSEGKVERANSMLGYTYFLEETVIKGEQIGRKIGFKTANLIYPDDLVEIGLGVYKVSAEYQGETYAGIANYGLRPTITHDGKPVLEVHLFGFNKEIYGEKIKVNILKKIRDEKKFSSLDELKYQIKQDIKNSK